MQHETDEEFLDSLSPHTKVIEDTCARYSIDEAILKHAFEEIFVLEEAM